MKQFNYLVAIVIIGLMLLMAFGSLDTSKQAGNMLTTVLAVAIVGKVTNRKDRP